MTPCGREHLQACCYALYFTMSEASQLHQDGMKLSRSFISESHWLLVLAQWGGVSVSLMCKITQRWILREPRQSITKFTFRYTVLCNFCAELKLRGEGKDVVISNCCCIISSWRLNEAGSQPDSQHCWILFFSVSMTVRGMGGSFSLLLASWVGVLSLLNLITECVESFSRQIFLIFRVAVQILFSRKTNAPEA